MTLEQNPSFLPDSAGNLGLDAVASPDQHLGVFRQNDRQHIAAILGNDRVAWSVAVIVMANQFSLDERRSGLSFVRSDNRNIDERGSIDVFEQKVSGTTRKACGNGMVFDHPIIPTFHTRKYPPRWCGCPVANGEFVPYNRSMGKPNLAKRTVRALERRLAEMKLPPETAALGQRLLLALKMVPGQERLLKSPAFANCVLPAITKFHVAHLAHKSASTCSSQVTAA